MCWYITITGTQTTKKVICDEINVINATVPSIVNLELKANGSGIHIEPGFQVESGAGLIIL
jgi:hypothetical protein